MAVMSPPSCHVWNVDQIVRNLGDNEFSNVFVMINSYSWYIGCLVCGISDQLQFSHFKLLRHAKNGVSLFCHLARKNLFEFHYDL
jgi:hypothetical protein